MIHTMDLEQMKKLAHLARVGMTDDELEKTSQDLSAILEYVQLIESVDVDVSGYTPRQVNVMREDDQAIETGAHTKQLLAEAPDTQDDYIKVQKIL